MTSGNSSLAQRVEHASGSPWLTPARRSRLRAAWLEYQCAAVSVAGSNASAAAVSAAQRARYRLDYQIRSARAEATREAAAGRLRLAHAISDAIVAAGFDSLASAAVVTDSNGSSTVVATDVTPNVTLSVTVRPWLPESGHAGAAVNAQAVETDPYGSDMLPILTMPDVLLSADMPTADALDALAPVLATLRRRAGAQALRAQAADWAAWQRGGSAAPVDAAPVDAAPVDAAPVDAYADGCPVEFDATAAPVERRARAHAVLAWRHARRFDQLAAQAAALDARQADALARLSRQLAEARIRVARATATP